ncbi:uncharacterized protein MELLADRAFT_96006 [Melampsora larici-populina 98AG31]|uniref:Uncharacterized protein n=1 Tax=Melampsora larici-populina (strain 98AG31 / pathotype 3-4-7) TaxID=747676 RepID=F4RE28_MELLP|nr:uncharacterized protein MELLADRAFT_96006 [Melampsora larici-populina 98AG31]EGG09511.1 hypothetical protein MELLADRAFT_96006 [Melampsora larici-populina 98AG31]
MAEPVQIEHGHAKWLFNINEALNRDMINQYRVFKEEYQIWCEKEGTEPRDLGLMNFTFKEKKKESENQTETTKDKSKTKIETNTKMIIGSLPTNDMTGLSQYFHDIMINKNIHMSVSIFDPTWILQDALFMKTRSTKTSCSTNVISYVGLPYVNEYRLTSNEWSTRFNLMVKYQAEKYDILDSQKDSPIAPRLRLHKENVLQIQVKNYGKWTPAMRYDIAHRRNVWENRLPDGSMADVGTLNVELAERAKEDAKHFNDYNYVDNPYAFGNVMQNISPLNGETYPQHASWDSNHALIDTQAEMLTGRNLSVSNNQPVNPVVGSNLSVLANGKAVKYKVNNPYGNAHDYSNNGYVSQPYYNSSPFYHNQHTFMPNVGSNRGGSGNRGGMRGGNHRGGRGAVTGRGGNLCPSIGPGSFDKSIGASGSKNAEGSGNSNSASGSM